MKADKKKFATLKKNRKATELIKRKDVKDTPFTIISLTDKKQHFAAMGSYRITESYDTAAKAEAEVKKVTWNRIIQVTQLLIESNEKIKKQ